MRTIRTRQYSCLPSVPADRDKIVSVDGLIDWAGCTRARGGRSGLASIFHRSLLGCEPVAGLVWLG